MKTALTIAGSDSIGGAGIQADIKTITMHGVYAMSAVTALTAQNTTGVYGIYEAPPEFMEKQLDCIFTDVFPDAVKIGMLSSAGLILAIAKKLAFYEAKHIILDPVMVSTSGSRLLANDALNALCTHLIPLAELITPNIPEAEVLLGQDIRSEKDMEAAAQELGRRYGCAVLLKGGHNVNDANDLLFSDESLYWFYGERIFTSNTHGTGCTLSSAIAANRAKGLALPEAIRQAKNYLSGALRAGLDLGKGPGPMNHAFCLEKSDFQKG